MPPAVAVVTAIKGAVAAAGIMKSMAVAGTALSLVGTVTKNPKLAKIGAVVGTVGSLGAMGAFGAGAKTLGMSSAAKAAAAAPAAATTAGAGARQTLARQALDSTAKVGPLSPSAGGYAGQGLLRSNIADQATRNALQGAGTDNAVKTLFRRTGEALKAGTQMVKNNPELAQIVAAGGQELANYLSGKTDAEIRALESQIDNSDANAQRTLQIIEQEKRRRQNLNQGYLTVNPVITMPGQPGAYQPPGLLQQNMTRTTP